MAQLGLFIIPIRFRKNIKTYNDYINYVAKLEDFGYSHLFIGEHLTDNREDIKSSMIFSAAVLAKTKKINVCLCVLPLPHYEIKLLIKQLEDLYLLSEGRLLIGLGPGALKSDAVYLGIKHEERGRIFPNKLEEFLKAFKNSPILNSIPNENLFSTLLSPFPEKANLLIKKGFSLISSNFTHSSHMNDHYKCIWSDIDKINSKSKWHRAYNVLPMNEFKFKTEIIKIHNKTYSYIFNKLGKEYGTKIMLGKESEFFHQSEDLLFKELTLTDEESIKSCLRGRDFGLNGFPIINLFDCIDDHTYDKMIEQIPEKYLIG